ncbi:hypothetical protein LHYA1_G008461 [Lachnellula hyalina]|uniref:Uncharacterized protein n=1 Tax=Lachnellula hyalina TaxID=1316788 RepID=A0A8H8QV61_9HELO|nr:uncharacterized protein LHYA1_G008461 [Lachnellula hyalina]TVY22730.1 hypothetical protein LHYA1_G008461 [Lachnellula hyalina]
MLHLKHPPKPTPTAQMFAYRGPDNHTVQYTTLPTTRLNAHDSDNDSDGQPLIRAQIDEEAVGGLENFTATGRPMPVFKHSALQSMGGDMFSLPQLLPRQYTDDSIIPAIVTNVIRKSEGNGKKDGEDDGVGNGNGNRKRRKSFLGKLMGGGEEEKWVWGEGRGA